MNALVDQSAQTAVMDTTAGDPFAIGAEDAGSSTYVKFKGASGEYLAGQDEDVIDHGTQFVADIFNAKWIWSFWWDGKVLETVDGLLREQPLLNKQMPDFLPDNDDVDMTLDEIKKMQKEDPANFRDGWSVQASFGMLPVDGSDEDYTMRLGGMVSLNAFDALRKAFSRRYKLEMGKDPVIELTANKYKSKVKGVGTRSAPVMKIVEWLSPEDLMSFSGGNADDYADAAPADEPAQIEAPAEAVSEAPTTAETPAATGRGGRRGARGRNVG